MHKTIYLVRHATYSTNPNILPGRLPVPLSEEGKKEAERLREYFKDKNISKIYSSAVLRAKETSEIIANGTIPIQFDKRILEGQTAYQGFWLDNDKTPRDHFYVHLDELGGETRTQISNRVIEFFEEMKNKDEGNTIICAHGDPLFFLYLHLTKEPISEDYTQHYGTRPEYLSKGAVRIVEIEDGEAGVGEMIGNSEL